MNTARKKSNFSSAFYSLPKPQRDALDVLYAYCREIDDIVDENDDKTLAREQLEQWQSNLKAIKDNSKKLEGLPGQVQGWVQSYPNHLQDLEWILKGCFLDLEKNRYVSYSELQNYCDAVASAVGLCVIGVLGQDREKYYDYAMATGRALQLTNILRDVDDDFKRDRIYLPQEEMKKFEYSERDLKNKTYNQNFTGLMAFQKERAEHFFTQSQAYLSDGEKSKLFAAEFMRDTYHCILKNIQKKNYQVFKGKIGLNTFQKFNLVVKTFVMSR